VELIDDKVAELRRYVAGFVPRKICLADNAFARKWRYQFPCIWIPLRTLVAFADDVEHIALAVPHTGDESSPMAVTVAREQTPIGTLAIVEVAEHVHGARMRSPYAKGCAIGDQVRAHWRVRQNMVEGGWHSVTSQRVLRRGASPTPTPTAGRHVMPGIQEYKCPVIAAVAGSI